jgi:hypothetical protein
MDEEFESNIVKLIGLGKERDLRTKPPKQWRKVLFQRSTWAVKSVSLPTEKWTE